MEDAGSQWLSQPTGDRYLPPFRIENKDVYKLRSTLRQVVREWTREGKAEREAAFLPLIKLVEQDFPQRPARPDVKVLCPVGLADQGSGLGRLPFEFVCRGFSAEGNEFSYFMLLTSNYIMNDLDEQDSCRIAPNIHSLCNKLSAEHIFQYYSFPDVTLSKEVDPKASFSMVAGEFVEVYGEKTGRSDSLRRLGCRGDLLLHRHCPQRRRVPADHLRHPQERRHMG